VKSCRPAGNLGSGRRRRLVSPPPGGAAASAGLPPARCHAHRRRARSPTGRNRTAPEAAQGAQAQRPRALDRQERQPEVVGVGASPRL
jgi:hypothetical protein